MVSSLTRFKQGFIEKSKYAVSFFQIRDMHTRYISAVIKYKQDHTAVTFPATLVTLHGVKFKSRENSMDIPHLSYLYEPATTKLLLTSRPKIFIDIGTHVGRYSLLAASQGSDVLSFEPSKKNFKQFLANMRLNKLKGRITPLNIGLSSRTGTDTLYYIPSQEGLSSLLEANNSQKETVRVDILDNIIRKQKADLANVDIIKIDTEGTELDILKGSTYVLAEGNATLIIEILDSELKKRINSFLQKFGYRCNQVLDGRNYIFKKE